MSGLKKVLIVTSGQPSLNPRMVKEADTLTDAGYEVTVLYAYWNDWGTKFDATLIPSKKWKAICVGGDPQHKNSEYFLSRMIHKSARAFNKIGKGKWLAELAIARSGYFLMREAPKYQADIYIAHNLGALPAVARAANAHEKPFAFDAEDFHRNEVSDDKANPDVMLKTYLEYKYFPQLNYLTVSSPLIAKAYKELFPDLQPQVILNLFPQNDTIKQPTLNAKNPIRLFWFSQTIGPNRGLEDIIGALELLREHPFELHLLGHIQGEGQIDFIKASNAKVFFHSPLPPDDVMTFASQFDIGLALENSEPHNRDICLTNKIFTYIQAGLALVASNTQGQKQLLTEYQNIGHIYEKGNITSLVNVLSGYYQDRESLLDARVKAFELGRNKLNWENEGRNLPAIVEQTIKTT